MKKISLFLVGILMVLILACQISSPMLLLRKATVTPDLPFQGGGFAFGAQEWPAYIPDVIPPVPGTINTIFADDVRIRIFFNDVSEKEMQAYLKQFEDAGFSLQYLLFYSDGQQEPSQKEIDKGAYDAVDISKGEYRIRIEYGDNEGTMDIDAKPFAGGVRSGPQWPVELHGVLVEPDCELDAVFGQADGLLNIICKSDNVNLLSEYSATLIESGFEIVQESRNQNDEVYAVELQQGEVQVSLREYQPGEIGIAVQMD